ncbi:hypothetical protein QJQ45_012581, partial [Haematococcus lacustris]
MAMINTLKQQAATAGTASRRAIVPMVGMCTLPKLTSSTPLSYPAQSWAAPSARRSLASSPQAVAVAAPVAAPATAQGLSIDLRGALVLTAGTAYRHGTYPTAPTFAGKKVFIAGVADDQVPALNIFETNLRRGKLDESRKLSNGSLMEFSHVYPMDAVFDSPEDVPEDIATNKRYAGNSGWTVSECAAKVAKDVGKVDVVVHSLANGPEVKNPLLETSRKVAGAGYLAAVSASAYSFVSMVRHFGPHMNPGGAFVNLTYNASNVVIPGYGGGMTSAKAALESDTRVLAYEAGRKWGVRVNSISAGPLGSRAARAIGFIDDMIRYSYENSPIQKELSASEIGSTAAFLVSPLASAITGQ